MRLLTIPSWKAWRNFLVIDGVAIFNVRKMWDWKKKMGRKIEALVLKFLICSHWQFEPFQKRGPFLYDNRKYNKSIHLRQIRNFSPFIRRICKLGGLFSKSFNTVVETNYNRNIYNAKNTANYQIEKLHAIHTAQYRSLTLAYTVFRSNCNQWQLFCRKTILMS